MVTAIVVLTLMGLVLGVLLGLAARYFAVDDKDPVVEQIEALLPNSQCGQCGFAGCSPAAQAIADGSAEITCCPPGGQLLVEKLAEILDIDMDSLSAEIALPVVAKINPEGCTGCTRCYKACPTDAIVGANKQLHVVMTKACTGCRKCFEACPEDCINMAPEDESIATWHWPKPEAA